MEIRVGQGFDVHSFCIGRPLILGGVKIEHPKGLEGHSDADVLLHAITDALLGAAGLEDIGNLFPNTDQAWKDADSGHLLKIAWQKISGLGWEIVNLDCSLLMEEPKISPYRSQILVSIAEILVLKTTQCNLKATTMEGMSFIGRKEGIMASCVCLLKKEA